MSITERSHGGRGPKVSDVTHRDPLNTMAKCSFRAIGSSPTRLPLLGNKAAWQHLVIMQVSRQVRSLSMRPGESQTASCEAQFWSWSLEFGVGVWSLESPVLRAKSSGVGSVCSSRVGGARGNV